MRMGLGRAFLGKLSVLFGLSRPPVVDCPLVSRYSFFLYLSVHRPRTTLARRVPASAFGFAHTITQRFSFVYTLLYFYCGRVHVVSLVSA